MIWLLDNGHGKDTPGKRSPEFDFGQLFEYEFTRDIVDRIHRVKRNAYVLVPELWDVSLDERIRRVNSTYLHYKKMKVPVSLISVHANAYSDPDARGWEIFTSVGKTKSDEYAEVFYKEAQRLFPNEKFRPDLSDNDHDKEARFAMIQKTLCPAVLTENFFYTNPRECKMLLDDDIRDKIAQLHINAMNNIEGCCD